MHVAHICDLLTFLSSDFFLTAARGRGLITRRRILEGFGNIGEFRFLLLYLEILNRLSSFAMKHKSKVLDVGNPMERLDCIIRGKKGTDPYLGEQKVISV